MKSGNARQRLARRLTWILGIPLLPVACYGFAVPLLKGHPPAQPSGIVVEKFTRAIQVADWKTATSYYTDAPRLKAELTGSLSGFQLSQSTSYFLPFSGEHEMYFYSLRGNRRNARLIVDVVASGDTWSIYSARLLPDG